MSVENRTAEREAAFGKTIGAKGEVATADNELELAGVRSADAALNRALTRLVRRADGAPQHRQSL